MIIFPSAVIPVAGALIFNQFFATFHWVHEPFHSLVEAIGSFAALILALFIITMRNNKQLNPRYIWVATTLMAMGLLDGFHAGVSPGNEFVWLHSLATFLGGVTFALVVLPDRISRLPILNFAPAFMALCAISIGLLSVAFPNLIPSMLNNGQFTVTAELLNIIGGVGFIIASVYFIRKNNIEDKFERHLLANHTLLFGAAALLFHFSIIWDATWWLWHILRLAAYLVILTLFLRIYLESVTKIRINEQKLKENKLELEHERTLTNGIIENTPSLIALKDLEEKYILVNDPFSRLTNSSKEQIYGQTASELFQPNIANQLIELDKAVLTQNQSVESEISMSIKGQDFTFITTAFPLKDANKNIYAIGSILTDITQRKKTEDNLKLAQKIIDHTNEGIIVTDPDGTITDVNVAYSEVTGFSQRELINKNPRFLQSGKHDSDFYNNLWEKLRRTGHWSGEIWDNKKDGKTFPQWLSISAINDENKQTIHYVGIMHDITEEKKLEAELKNIAYYDSLTGIPNRVLFKENLVQEIAQNQRDKTKLAVFLLDLDNFKLVNDSLGHDAGDELLNLAAQRLKQHIRKSDSVARFGGDEFALILPHLDDYETASNIAQKIIDDLKKPFVIHDNVVNIGASIGVSTFPNDADNVELLIKYADLALYSAKRSGRNAFKFFSQKLQDEINSYIELQHELKAAITNQEFEVYYQPKIELQTNKLVGMEALIRWNHPKKGLVPPCDFINFSEQAGLIINIGEWILNEACFQAEKWSQQFNTSLEVSVNLSTKQFKDQNLIQVIKQALDQNKLNRGTLQLEITESSLIDNIEEAIQVMNDIKSLNISLAIDDFGTGFSSLNYLKRFPINTLKIDRSFIKDLVEDSDDKAIIESIILMSDKLNLNVVAEGIEQTEQLVFLNQNNCHYGQGYLFSKPLNTKEFEQYLTHHMSSN